MGLMDGAVNGMVSRLVQAGFTPPEGFCLAQAAYIKQHKRAAGVPRAVLDRKGATWEINQALAILGAYPMGPEAHRQRIILWEKVFGRGSWHEPIDPEEIYGHSNSDTSQALPSSAVDYSGVPAVERKRFEFILPGQSGKNTESYAQVLAEASESELYSRARTDGYSIDPDTVQIQIIDVDDLRRQGHNMQTLGVDDDTYLVAHAIAEGTRQ